MQESTSSELCHFIYLVLYIYMEIEILEDKVICIPFIIPKKKSFLQFNFKANKYGYKICENDHCFPQLLFAC